MTPAWQGMVKEAWRFVTTIAPRDDWDRAAAQIIPQLYEDAKGRGELRGSSPTLSRLDWGGCGDASASVSMGDGWAAASTTNSCLMDFLQADVGARLLGDDRVCEDCNSVHAYIHLPTDECRYYAVHSRHRWGNNPTGGASTGTEGYVGC